MNSNTLGTALIALIVGLGLGWFGAQRMGTGGMDHSAMGHDVSSAAAPRGDQGEASKAFAKVNATMHTGMDIEFSGNTDVDFAKGMIPHHQGAVDMAKILLQYGKDADLRKLAEGVVSTQESEIKFMTEWLAKTAK
ncbi:MAG: CopM family metallochaperone [Rhizobiaceae bacterium]